MSAAARTVYLPELLRDSRHREARSARELAEWLAWLALAGKATRTLDTYERTCAALLRAFPGKAFNEFTDADVAFVLNTFPPKSRHTNRSALNGWFEWGEITRRVESNPMRMIPKMRYKPNRSYDIFAEAEADALCSLPSPDGPLMTILFWAGLRKAEARMLTAKRFDFESLNLIVIDGAKGSRTRRVPLVPRLATAVSDLLLLEGLGPDDHLWYCRPGGGRTIDRSRPIGDTTFSRWWLDCLKRAGVRHRNPHMARHTYATRLHELGLPDRAIQKMLGHEKISTTMDTYVHSDVGEFGDLLRELVGGREEQ